MKKTVKSILLGSAIMLLAAMPVFAGQWQSDNNGRWYLNDDGYYPVNGWQWIDGKCYYFDQNGTCLINMVTPDGYVVDGDGAWVVDGVVQIQTPLFEAGWIYGTYEYHDSKIDASANIGWASGDGTEFIELNGVTKDGLKIGRFYGEIVSSKDHNYVAVDNYGNAISFYYNGVDSIEITDDTVRGENSFPGFNGLYPKTADLSHDVS